MRKAYKQSTERPSDLHAHIPMGSIDWEIRGVKRLWAYVMIVAVMDLQRSVNRTTKTTNGQQHNASNIRKRDRAYWWFFESESDYIGSLKYICQVFGLDVGEVRRFARNLYESSVRQPGVCRRPSLAVALKNCEKIFEQRAN